MQLPSWIMEIARGLECPFCCTAIDERSLRSVGVAMTTPPDAAPRSSPRLEFVCPGCKYTVAVTTEVPMDDLLEAVAVIRHFPAEIMASRGKLNAVADRGVEAIGPFDDIEMRTLLKQISRLSFRRDTKNFRQWIKRLDDGGSV